jgi:hypothetical protein
MAVLSESGNDAPATGDNDDNIPVAAMETVTETTIEAPEEEETPTLRVSFDYLADDDDDDESLHDGSIASAADGDVYEEALNPLIHEKDTSDFKQHWESHYITNGNFKQWLQLFAFNIDEFEGVFDQALFTAPELTTKDKDTFTPRRKCHSLYDCHTT